jgi:hypothetical protein
MEATMSPARCFWTLFLLSVIWSTAANAQITGAYRSAESGNWNTPAIWERYNGATWQVASASPSSSDGIITIRNGNSITITANVTVDELVVESGGVLTNTTTFTVANGAGTDMIVYGTFLHQQNITINASATVVIEGIMISSTTGAQFSMGSSNASLSFADGSYYEWGRNGGNLPPPTKTTWNPNATCAFTGITNSLPSNIGQTYGHFVYNCPSQTTSENMSQPNLTVTGNLEIISTGSGLLQIAQTSAGTLTVGGNLIQSGGIFELTTGGDRTVNVAGSLSMSGGTMNFNSGGAAGNLTMNVQMNFTMNGGTIAMSTYPGTNASNGNGRLNLGGDFSQIGGTITETATGTGTGTIAFVGTSNQSFASSGAISNTINFIINKSSGTLSLNSAMTVNGTATLTMTSGNINTGAFELTLGSSATSTGTFVYTSGTIIGTFTQWLAATTATRVFPIGTAIDNRLANVTFTAAPSAGGTLSAAFIASNPGSNGLPLDDGGTSIINVGTDGYWSISAGNGLTGGTYSMDLNATAFTAVNNYASLRLLKRTPGNPWTLAGTHSAGTGSNSSPVVHRTGLSGFSEFGIGGSSDNPLPIELTAFSAVLLDGIVHLHWSTATEKNNFGFEILRAPNATDWTNIGFVVGHGTTDNQQRYSFDDALALPLPQNGAMFYRLKQLDRDGQYRFSDIAVVAFAGNADAQSVSVFPNPMQAGSAPLTVSYRVQEASNVRATLYDNSGREIAVLREMAETAGWHSAQWSMPSSAGLSTGVYYCRVVIEPLSAHPATVSTQRVLLSR